jgi:predicted PurR-regulated permease PerM
MLYGPGTVWPQAKYQLFSYRGRVMVLEVFQNKWVRAVGLLGAIVVVSTVLYLLSAVLVPLFFAFIVAYVFDPVIDKIETYKVKGRHISRVAAIVTLVGSIILSAIILPLLIVPSAIHTAEVMMRPPIGARPTGGGVAPASGAENPDDSLIAPRQSDEEAKEAMKFREMAAAKLEEWLALDSVVKFMELPGSEVENPDSMALIKKAVGEKVATDSESFFRSFIPQWKDAGSSIIRMLSLIGDAFLSSFLLLGNFVLFAFVAIYLLKDYDHIVASCDDLVPLRYRKKVRTIMSNIDRQLRSFLRGQVTVCCCLGVMYAIGFLIAGVPFALLLALMGALFSFIPYLGLILTIGPAVLLTVLTYGPFNWHVGAVLATFAIAQFLEGNFLTPRIVGSQVGLGPVWVILAIMVFGSTMGFAGLLLAVPIAAVLKVLLSEAMSNYRTSDFFSGVDDEDDDDVFEPESAPAKGSKGRKAGTGTTSTSPSTGKGRRLKKV